jgi:aminocarboxymuconate-semialdehyde decarboxylase
MGTRDPLAALRAADLPEAAYDAIRGGNVARLLGLL